MMWNLQSYPSTVLNERMWPFRGSKHTPDPSYIFSGGSGPPTPMIYAPGGTTMCVHTFACINKEKTLPQNILWRAYVCTRRMHNQSNVVSYCAKCWQMAHITCRLHRQRDHPSQCTLYSIITRLYDYVQNITAGFNAAPSVQHNAAPSPHTNFWASTFWKVIFPASFFPTVQYSSINEVKADQLELPW